MAQSETNLDDLDRSVEPDREWVLPEIMLQRAEAGTGVAARYLATADGSDPSAAQQDAILDPAYADLYVDSITAHLRRLGFDPSGNVLDGGCGLGVVTDAFRRALHPTATVHGLDLVPAVIDAAQSKHPKCAFAAGSADDLSQYPDNHFNVMHFREFYPFTRSAKVGFHLRFLEAFLPKLRPGGVAIAVQIVDQRGLADTFSELRKLCLELGYDDTFREVTAPMRLYRRWGDMLYGPMAYRALSIAGAVVETIKRSKVSYLYGFRKRLCETEPVIGKS